MQAPLAIAGALGATSTWLLGGSVWWVIGALCMAAIIPFTLFVVLPTNKYLLSEEAEADLGSAAASLALWNRLHFARTILSAIAFVTFGVLLGTTYPR